MKDLFKPKLFSLLKRGISRKQLITDIMAGVVVGIVALPLAIAFAVASGVSPEKGLITAVIAGAIVSILGGSRVQIGGPTGAFVVIVYGIVEQYGIDGLIISTIMAGLFLILFGVLKLGSLLKYFPHPLVVGFTSGIAVVIFTTQIKNALGLNIDNVPVDFVEKWLIYFQHIDTINIHALGLTVGTILITVFSPKLTKKIPGSFIAIVVTTIAVALLPINTSTIATFFGEITGSFSLVSPQFHWHDLSKYIGPAVTIAMLGSIESLLSAVVSDGMISGNHRSNTELIAQGVANIVSPLFGGIPATGAIARTATNVKNGGRTPVAGVVHAITLLLIMLFFGQLASLIPMATLAGILMVVSYNMSEWRSFKTILHGSAFDILVMLSTFFLTVLVDLTVAIEVGVVLSALLFMKRMADNSDTQLKEIDSDVIEDYSAIPDGVSIYEISGPFFFASAKTYVETLKRTGGKSNVLIIRMRHVPFIDSTGIRNFGEVIRLLQSSGVIILLSGVIASVDKDLAKANIISLVDRSHVFNAFTDALDHATSLQGESSADRP